MNMIRHAMYSEHLSFSVLDQAGNIFMQFIFIFSIDEAVPTLDREDKMKVDFKICVGHYVRDKRRTTETSERYSNLIFSDGYSQGSLNKIRNSECIETAFQIDALQLFLRRVFLRKIYAIMHVEAGYARANGIHVRRLNTIDRCMFAIMRTPTGGSSGARRSHINISWLQTGGSAGARRIHL
jgi:hypothetical protein